jgi:hypothetical protein
LVGNFDNPGATWLQVAYEVNAHDFLSDAQYRVSPYGLYDVLANHGHMVVGTSADTPRFAAEAVARWWSRIGCHRYRDAGTILLLADGGGSNGYRPRLWKASLQELLADQYGLAVTVCHLSHGGLEVEPRGASFVRSDQPQLGGSAAEVPFGSAGLPAGHGHADGLAGNGRVVATAVCPGREGVGCGDGEPVHRTA